MCGKGFDVFHKCDQCGKDIYVFDESERFGLHYDNVGYGIRYDECHIDIDICCDCFDKMMTEYIEPKLKFKDLAIMAYEDFVTKHYPT